MSSGTSLVLVLDMASMILGLLVVSGFVWYIMTPGERERVVRAALTAIRHVQDSATQSHPKLEAFREALRARTRWALVTPTLVALNLTVFIFMLFGTGALSDRQTLVGWGANFGLRTMNGEWWRLVTAMFVHSGLVHLVINIAGLYQIGLILERLVGRFAFLVVYIAAGVFASLVSVSAYPVAVHVGASGAIFGMYGLLLAWLLWGMLQRSTMTIPLEVVKSLAPAAAVFILYNMAAAGLQRTGELTGFLAGFVAGLVLARGLHDCKPPARRVGAAMATAVAIAVAFAVPLRGVADVRPEIERVVAVEDRTAGAYRTAADQFRNGRITAAALAQLIDRTIMPDLQEARGRLKTLGKVPAEHQPLVAGAEEYLRLRDESWRLRAEGLRKASTLALRATGTEPDESRRRRAEGLYKANMLMLQKADSAERASLEALKWIRPAGQK